VVRNAQRRGGSSSSEQQILTAALDLFTEKGYHGSTIRQIADRASVSVPGLYHHFSSKRQLLERLMDDTMDALLAATKQAVAAHQGDPVALLKATVGAHVRFHIDFQRQSFVGNTELRSLVSPARERIVRKRDRQRELFDAAVAAGLRKGAFDTPYPGEAVRAIVTMCTAVANWYRAERALTPEQLVERYCHLSLEIVGHDVSPDGSSRAGTRNHSEEDR
jgi:AcrR family transcriptional regulator